MMMVVDLRRRIRIKSPTGGGRQQEREKDRIISKKEGPKKKRWSKPFFILLGAKSSLSTARRARGLILIVLQGDEGRSTISSSQLGNLVVGVRSLFFCFRRQNRKLPSTTDCQQHSLWTRTFCTGSSVLVESH